LTFINFFCRKSKGATSFLAEASAANGDTEAARTSYERAMEISPRAKEFIESRLAALPKD